MKVGEAHLLGLKRCNAVWAGGKGYYIESLITSSVGEVIGVRTTKADNGASHIIPLHAITSISE